MSGEHLQGCCLGRLGRVAAVFQDCGPRRQVVRDVAGGLPGIVEVFLAVGVDERVDGRVPAAVHLHERAVAAQADGGPDPDRPVAEHVAGYLQRDGVDVVVGEVVVPGPDESVQGAFDVGEERVAAQRGGQPDRAGLDGPGRAVPSKLTGRESVSTSPAGSGWRAWGPVAYQAVPVCVPFSYAEKVKVNATSG